MKQMQVPLREQISRCTHLAHNELESVTTEVSLTTVRMVMKRDHYQALCKGIHIVTPDTGMLLPG